MAADEPKRSPLELTDEEALERLRVHYGRANFAKFELGLLFAEMTRRFNPPVVITEPDVEPNIFARAVRSFELGYRAR